MDFYPASMENLIDKFASLPGVGRKSAQRLAFHMRVSLRRKTK